MLPPSRVVHALVVVVGLHVEAGRAKRVHRPAGLLPPVLVPLRGPRVQLVDVLVRAEDEELAGVDEAPVGPAVQVALGAGVWEVGAGAEGLELWLVVVGAFEAELEAAEAGAGGSELGAAADAGVFVLEADVGGGEGAAALLPAVLALGGVTLVLAGAPAGLRPLLHAVEGLLRGAVLVADGEDDDEDELEQDEDEEEEEGQDGAAPALLQLHHPVLVAAQHLRVQRPLRVPAVLPLHRHRPRRTTPAPAAPAPAVAASGKLHLLLLPPLPSSFFLFLPPPSAFPDSLTEDASILCTPRIYTG